MSSVTTERARIAALSRSRPKNDPELIEARQRLKTLRLEAHVQKALDQAPPITPEQANRIASLLRPVTGGER